MAVTAQQAAHLRLMSTLPVRTHFGKEPAYFRGEKRNYTQEIFDALKTGPQMARDVAYKVGLAKSTTASYLAALRRDGRVKRRGRKGKYIYSL